MSNPHLSIPLTQTISPTSTAHNSTTELISRACVSMEGSREDSQQPVKRCSPSYSRTSNEDGVLNNESTDGLQGRDKNDARNGDISLQNTQQQRPESQIQEEKIKNEKEENVNNNMDIVPGCPSIKMIFPPWRRNDGWSGWMSDTVTADSLVLCLILQAFSTGILDATTYLDFSTFASNQTGNTILLTVAVVRVSGHLLLLTGISLSSFLSAALVFGHIGHFLGVRRRIWLLSNVICQIIFLILAAIFLSSSGPQKTRLGEKHEWVIISLFAIMSGAQVAAARQASIQEIPTAPMTSSYVDLVSDKYLFVGFNNENSKGRNRRLSYILAMIIGSFIGGLMHKYAGSWVVVVVAMAFKLAVVGLMCIAPSEVRSKKEKEKEKEGSSSRSAC